MNTSNYDYLIIGAGIIGLNICRELIDKYPTCKILILEKEPMLGNHSSGRNSGVLHTGFYYKENSLKAKFSSLGNKILQNYCILNNLPINKCGKVVVANSEDELVTLNKLYSRGVTNGSNIVIIDEKELKEIEPNAKTLQKAIFSPNTATINPNEVLNSILKYLISSNQVTIKFNEGYKKYLKDNTILSTNNTYYYFNTIINAAGLYADKIAKDFGYSENYVIVPFKGIYLKYTGSNLFIKRNVYPTPNINNPFLGVHFTVNVNNEIKIGPTSIPVLWRENYRGFDNFKFKELVEILYWECKLFAHNSFNFRTLAFDEIKKYYKPYLLNQASKLVHKFDRNHFSEWSKPGIRAQLLNKNTLELLQDFIIEGDKQSLHILNAVSPGFTCSMPFSHWIVKTYLS